MKNYYKILLLLTLITLSSCKKWLDVKPKTQIESSSNFVDEQGFKDALTGVYLNMAKTDLYGKELSYGFIEVLGKNYTQSSSFNSYYEDGNYNYKNASTKTRIDNVWKLGYNSIANLNNLIENINTADLGLFAGSDYNVIKGEAYGLRAFLHFDLLRLYAPSAASAGLNGPGIPYRDQLQTGNIPRSTIGQTINKIIADLQVASAALKTGDPLVKGSVVPATTTGYLRDRSYKFNYYAVQALLARVYLYAGDKVNALASAREVINADVFPATAVSTVIAGNRIMSTEVIFNINFNNLATVYDASFSLSVPTGMYLSGTEWDTVYERTTIGSGDYRYLYQTNQTSYFRVSTKLSPAGNTAAPNRLPLIRVSEMYDIAAECLSASDPVAAVNYLNVVRRRRNIPDLVGSFTADQVQAEVFKEYRKDFICEGQLFYYYKRLNLAKIEFSQVVANNTIYVLPVPDDEIEFGNVN